MNLAFPLKCNVLHRHLQIEFYLLTNSFLKDSNHFVDTKDSLLDTECVYTMRSPLACLT